jgi:hypothetical protein
MPEETVVRRNALVKQKHRGAPHVDGSHNERLMRRNLLDLLSPLRTFRRASSTKQQYFLLGLDFAVNL